MAVNFSKNQDEITKAWRDVVDSSNIPKWALFGYEGSTNNIRLMTTGALGLDELVVEFNCSLIQYAFCRVIDDSLGLNRLVLINWQGDSAPLSRKGLCASHVGDVSNYFKGCAQTITIRNDDEATKEHLMEQILKTSASKLGLSRISSQSAATTTSPTTTNDNHGTPGGASIRTLNDTNDSSSADASVSSSTEATSTPTTVSSVYTKVDIGSDIAASRKSFWQRQEEEERERIAEEKRRAAEKQAQFEKERKQREELEAKKLAETIRQRDQLIEATKKADKMSASSSNQPSPIVSTTSSLANDLSDDDGRVGRRSELIRLERNQETQSLISKGLIKNKRAIFEQAQQQQQPTLSRRSSGAMITKRVSAFKSLDNNTSANSGDKNESPSSVSSVGKLSDSFAKQVNVNGDDSAKASPVPRDNSHEATVGGSTSVKKEIEAVTLTRESDSLDAPSPKSVVVSSTIESTNLDDNLKDTSSESQSHQPHENGSEEKANSSQDINGNSDTSFSPKKSSNSETAPTNDFITNEDLIMNGKNSSIKALALFDYQAADNTEISFDPEDQIGHIQKVDSGWWHGQVISGRFKGQIGLFPANYVQEL